MSKAKPIPANFTGQIKTTRGGRYRIDDIEIPNPKSVKKAIKRKAKKVIKGATVDKATARRDKGRAQASLKKMEAARDKITDPGKLKSANAAIERYKEANNL